MFFVWRRGIEAKEKAEDRRSDLRLFGAGIHNVLDEKHRHECAYSTVPQRYLCFHHKKRGIIMKKVKIKLDDMERRILVKLLYEKRNELIREGRYTDAIDELILKIIDAKGC